MGMIISGTTTYGKPLIASLANMPIMAFAFSEAVIDKAYLTWLDVSKLLTAFPEHVKVLGDTVIFQGPVAIISSMNPIHRLFAQCVLGLAYGAITYLFFKAISPKPVWFMHSDHPSHKRIRAIIFSLTSVYGFYLAGHYLPTQAGVYIFRQLPFYV